VAAALALWSRSILEWNSRYTTVFADGDAKTFLELQEAEVYGPDIQITKEECINHVAKRMTRGLKKIIDNQKVLGVTLGGRIEGSLKKQTITQLGQYYRSVKYLQKKTNFIIIIINIFRGFCCRKAISENSPNLEKMQQGILATLFHCNSTDYFPLHDYCPESTEDKPSWCFYRRVEAAGEEPESH